MGGRVSGLLPFVGLGCSPLRDRSGEDSLFPLTSQGGVQGGDSTKQ